jgi:hypothetical protein
MLHLPLTESHLNNERVIHDKKLALVSSEHLENKIRLKNNITEPPVPSQFKAL